jgi:hypothetical protein
MVSDANMQRVAKLVEGVPDARGAREPEPLELGTPPTDAAGPGAAPAGVGTVAAPDAGTGPGADTVIAEEALQVVRAG